MRPVTIVVAVMALVLAVAGWGGSEESSATTDTAVVTETTGEETTTEETTTTDATETDITGGLPSADCLQLISALASLGSAFVAPGGDTTDTSQFFDQFEAPEEIRADFQVLAEAYAAYAAAIQDVGLEAGQTPTADQLQQYQEALSQVDQRGVDAASERIGTWASTNCSGG